MLTEEEVVKALNESGCLGTVKVSFESGPYCIDRPTINASRFVEAIESAATAPLLGEIERLKQRCAELEKDAKRLDWMIFHGAKVCHSNDAEYCSVQWIDDYEQHQTDVYGDPRTAIDAASKEHNSKP